MFNVFFYRIRDFSVYLDTRLCMKMRFKLKGRFFLLKARYNM